MFFCFVFLIFSFLLFLSLSCFLFFSILVLGYGPLLIVQIFHLEFLMDLYFVGFRQSKYHKEVVTSICMFINQTVNLIASYFVARFSLRQINIKKACPLKWEIIIMRYASIIIAHFLHASVFVFTCIYMSLPPPFFSILDQPFFFTWAFLDTATELFFSSLYINETLKYFQSVFDS